MRARRGRLLLAVVAVTGVLSACTSAWMHPRVQTAGAVALAGNPLTVADPAPQTSGASSPVGTKGAAIGFGAVHVDVPSGAVPAGHTFSVPHTVTVPPQVGEVFGQPAGIEHDAPLAGPVTVRWQLPQLSTIQRDSLVLAKWDPAAKAWVARPDVPFRVQGGTLTAVLTDFSFWDWVANAGQKVGEVTGSRKGGPTCSKNGNKDDHLPAWVKGVVNPSEGSSAAAIQVCFEADHDDLVTVRVVNNRPFTQQLHMTSGGQQWAWTWPGPDTYDADSAIALDAHAALDSGTDYLIPPLSEVAVGIDRPGTPGSTFIAAQARVGLPTVFVDVVRFAFDQVDVGGFDNPVANALVQAVYQCGGKQMLGRPDGRSATELVSTALDGLHSCAEEIADPESEFGKRFRDLATAALEKAGKTKEAAKVGRLATEADNAFKVLTYGEVAFYAADQLQNKSLVGFLTLSIRGDGRPQAVGGWTPSCSDTNADSTALFKNLALQDEFSDKSRELWQFPQWASEAGRAVAPLSKCSSGYLAKLADALPGGWGDPRAAGVVADAIRALGGGLGRWTAPSLTFTDTSLGAVSLGMTTDAASQAAGLTFEDVGDGVSTPSSLPAGSAYLYLSGPCIGASENPGRTQKISAHGISLGDSGSMVVQVYGAAAQYIPAPDGGRTPVNGYVVPAGANRLAFVVSGGPSSPITAIKLGSADLTPSDCGG